MPSTWNCRWTCSTTMRSELELEVLQNISEGLAYVVFLLGILVAVTIFKD